MCVYVYMRIPLELETPISHARLCLCLFVQGPFIKRWYRHAYVNVRVYLRVYASARVCVFRGRVTLIRISDSLVPKIVLGPSQWRLQAHLD